MKTVYLALGSNVGDREAHLRAAISGLHAPDLTIQRVSPVYETAPQGFHEQSWFLNLVLRAETNLFPMQLLRRCQRVEQAGSRRRSVLNGPRTIDVDIILYGQAVVRSPQLEVPHPRYHERRFVLAPLADLARELRDPRTRRSIGGMLAQVGDQPLRPTDIRITAPPSPSRPQSARSVTC